MNKNGKKEKKGLAEARVYYHAMLCVCVLVRLGWMGWMIIGWIDVIL